MTFEQMARVVNTLVHRHWQWDPRLWSGQRDEVSGWWRYGGVESGRINNGGSGHGQEETGREEEGSAEVAGDGGRQGIRFD